MHKQFASQMHVCVDGTANLCCAICEWFAYCSLRTKICRLSAQTQRGLDAPGVLCSPQVCGKLFYHTPNANCSRTIWFTCVYHPLIQEYTCTQASHALNKSASAHRNVLACTANFGVCKNSLGLPHMLHKLSHQLLVHQSEHWQKRALLMRSVYGIFSQYLPQSEYRATPVGYF